MRECLSLDFGGPIDRPFEPFPERALDASIVDRFESIARRPPDRLAIQDQANSFTYFPGYKVISWIGLMAPAGTPKEIADQIAAEVGVAMKDQKFVERLKGFGADPLGNSAEEFKVMIYADIALWGEAVAIAGVKYH